MNSRFLSGTGSNYLVLADLVIGAYGALATGNGPGAGFANSGLSDLVSNLVVPIDFVTVPEPRTEAALAAGVVLLAGLLGRGKRAGVYTDKSSAWHPVIPSRDPRG